MKWSEEAETELKKVPFFVRKKVKARVEAEASEEGKHTITLAEVKATQKRFLSKMDSDIKGYQIENCFGRNGCPNRCVSGDMLTEHLENVFREADLLTFLKSRVKGGLKYHHEFRVGIAECPNACSQPQIKDISIIAASVPCVSAEPCSDCMACVDECREGAVLKTPAEEKPAIDLSACVFCGACVKVCPTGTLQTFKTGYRVQLGGCLGRHPRLAKELDVIFTESQVVELVSFCVQFYKEHSKSGERFSKLLDEQSFQTFVSFSERITASHE
jgi:dissimilatory sulfite reductase (desulfoviridin) alpha/beta subunit